MRFDSLKSIEQFDFFERVKYHSFYIGELKFRVDEGGIIRCQTHKHIKYVHQLQNLYYALTGEELTLKSIV